MNPSSTTGTRRAAPARITPTRPPISKPPTFASTSSPSRASGRLTSEGPAHHRHLARQRRVVDAGAPSGDALGRAAGDAPPRSRWRPSCCRCPSRRWPRRSAPAASACVGQRRAGLDRPDRLLARHRRARGDVGACRARSGTRRARSERVSGAATPRVGHHEPRPAWRASTFTAAPPRRKFSTICAVTTWGYALTPSATTP